MHFHRDVMAACECWPAHVLRPSPDDVFIGSPPLAFTFGLGGLLLFPLRSAPRRCCSKRPRPTCCSAPIERASRHASASPRPPSYRAMAPELASARRLEPAQVRVSAAKPLPAATRAAVEAGDRHRDHRRHRLDRAAAHLHLAPTRRRPRPAPPASRCPAIAPVWWTMQLRPLPRGQVGRLAVKGPTGCRYLADERQRELRAGRLEPDRRRLPASTTTATSSTRRAPTT